MVYKMSKNIQIKVSRYYVQNQESPDNRHTRQRILENQQGTRSNKPRKSSRVYLTLYIFIQQEKV